jgi:hypothetical protein
MVSWSAEGGMRVLSLERQPLLDFSSPIRSRPG